MTELQTCKALNGEIDSTGAKEAVLTEMATEGVPGRAHWAQDNPLETDAAPTAAQEEDDFGGQSPFGNTQLSETSTVVAMSPSDPLLKCGEWNFRWQMTDCWHMFSRINLSSFTALKRFRFFAANQGSNCNKQNIWIHMVPNGSDNV